MSFLPKKRKWFGKRMSGEINPDEIFLDSRNLPEFDTFQFEGRIEKQISKKTIYLFGAFFFLVVIGYSIQSFVLQIKNGEGFALKSDNNCLEHSVIFSQRGIIYDRNGKQLAWNSLNEDGSDFAKREYTTLKGSSLILGYVGYPLKDKKGIYYETEISGKDGVEKLFNQELNGENGLKIVEVDALNNIKSESEIRPPVNGENLHLSVDAELQNFMYETIEGLTNQVGFTGGAGVIMDVNTGEILAMTSYPEFDSNVMTNGEDNNVIAQYINDSRHVFLNRITSGLYIPGSIVKPFMAMAALTEGVISPDKQILSTGSISLQNPYNPDAKTVFKDWKAHGWVDMRKAIAVSSDVYFYEIGGGFEGQKGIGIDNIYKYMTLFGFGQKTGVEAVEEEIGLVPNQEWKKKVFDEDWYVGNTYHTSIGQYGFQVTPIQVVRSIAMIANKGTLLTPVVVSNSANKNSVAITGISESSFNIAQEGMKMSASAGGTAQGLSVPYVSVGAKTGTAELGVSKKYVNSWVVGFFPYEKPKYAFTIIMEHGPKTNTVGGVYVMRQVLDWMHIYHPKYLTNE